MLPTISVIDKNANSLKIIKSFLEEFSFVGDVNVYTNYTEGLNSIKNTKNDIVIADVSCCTEEESDIVNDIKLYTNKFIITSTDTSTDTIIRSLKAGAKDFLPKPVLKSDLEYTIKKLMQLPENNSVLPAKIITVYSNKGGIGKTTVAINLALELAKNTNEKVALIDLNLNLGDVATFLNINPVFDVSYVIKNLLNDKDKFLTQSFEKYKDTSMYVLADPSYIEQAESITVQQITKLFKALRKTFQYIIVDMSSNIDGNSLKILDESDWILFTTIVNIPAIRNAQRCLNLFSSRHYPEEKVKIVINRYMANDEISENDIETTLSKKIYWKIPNNYFTIMESINKGLTIAEINPKSNIVSSYKDFAEKIVDDIIEQNVLRYKG